MILLAHVPVTCVTALMQTARHKHGSTSHARSRFRDFQTSIFNKTRRETESTSVCLLCFIPSDRAHVASSSSFALLNAHRDHIRSIRDWGKRRRIGYVPLNSSSHPQRRKISSAASSRTIEIKMVGTPAVRINLR